MGEARSLLPQSYWSTAAVEAPEKAVETGIVTEAMLIEAVVQGDDRVAGLLYERLFPSIDRALCRLFGGRDRDHDDLVQTSLLQVVSSIAAHKFNGACPLAAWASAIATKVGLMALRSRCRERRVIDTSESVEGVRAARNHEIEPELDARARLRQVQLALAALTAPRAEALVLHDVVGYEIPEISALTGASPSAVQSRLVRGRRELMRLLADLDAREKGDSR
jgi:RNA polymerase sigma-70 factor (ECF subfamily)